MTSTSPQTDLTAPPVRTALIVLGMHRSGTSALAGVLGHLGAVLPYDLMAPSNMNAKGFFESNRITGLNDRLLAQAGFTWWDPRRFPAAWFDTPEAVSLLDEAVAALRADYGEAPLFILKDPRICRLLPFWRAALDRVGAKVKVVHTHRGPWDVAASLARSADYETDFGLVLWTRHVLDAEADSRDLPRSFTCFQALMDNWRAVARQIGRDLNLVWPQGPDRVAPAIEDFLSADLQHFKSTTAEGPNGQALPPMVSALQAMLDDWVHGNDPAQDRDRLDGMRASLDETGPLFYGLALRAVQRAHEVRHLMGRVTDLQSNLQNAVAQREADKVRADEQLAETHAALAHALDDTARQTEQIDKQAGQLVVLDQQLHVASVQLRELTEQRNREMEERLRLVIAMDDPSAMSDNLSQLVDLDEDMHRDAKVMQENFPKVVAERNAAQSWGIQQEVDSDRQHSRVSNRVDVQKTGEGLLLVSRDRVANAENVSVSGEIQYHCQAADSSETRVLCEICMREMQRKNFVFALEVMNVLLRRDPKNLTLIELRIKCLVNMGLHGELENFIEEHNCASVITPGLQIAFFDYYIASERYHEAFSHVWMCLTKSFNVEVFEYFRDELLRYQSMLSGFLDALDDLDTDISGDPLQRIALAFSDFEFLPEIFGKSENMSRVSNLPRKNDTRTIMIVSHDASRTGAPILALNLARAFGKRYNIVTVILGGGDLVSDFLAESVELLQLDRRNMSPEWISKSVAEVINDNEICMAFVNSIESRCVLPALKQSGVPSVSLVHEFAAYTRPKSAFPVAFSTSDHVVFSTEIILENALSTLEVERPVNVHILPQGKCVSQLADTTPDGEERRWLDSVLRPNGGEGREFLVIGAGAVQTRKGLDLFIETATRIATGPGGGQYRFVWIGHGYDPENDLTTSVYLADQIERAGIQGQLQIVRATTEIEYAYHCADMLLLSSRLDPLPNVAIDMLLAGKPVMCFDRTTGIVEFLRGAGLGADCVAGYLDTTDMARKIRALAENPSRLAQVTDRGTKCARQTFDFETYARRLEEIAIEGGRKAEGIETDLVFIRETGAFRSDFATCVSSEKIDEDASIRQYLESSRSGPYLRKPAPGFNQLIYAEENGWGKAQDPFAAFLSAGQPDGRWKTEVIDDTSPIDCQKLEPSKVALHVHAFFVDEFKDIITRLGVNRVRPTLFVSTTNDEIKDVENALKVYDGPVAALSDVPNRGRDIAPLLTLFGPRMVSDFDIVGHLHTKRSKHIDDRKFVENWREFLMENTLGGPKGGQMLDRIVTAINGSPDLGIVYPDDPHLIGWAQNMPLAARLAAQMGIKSLPSQINYPMGTMFWARAGLIRQFVELELDWNDYPAEPVPRDGTLLHSLERLFGVTAKYFGYRTAVTNVRGLTR